MKSILSRCELIAELYDNSIAPEIMRWTPELVADFDNHINRLTTFAKKLDDPAIIGLLGTAAAGKSTLLNAVAFEGQLILPTGGVGALTAQATRICYATDPYFEVTYSAKATINQLIFGLRTTLARKHRDSAKDEGGGRSVSLDVDDNQAEDMIAALEDEVDGCTEQTRVERQAALLIKGNQNTRVSTEDLISALEMVLDKKPSSALSTLDAEDQHRIKRIAEVVRLNSSNNGAPLRRKGRWDDPLFRKELREHAAGFLAPLVTELKVGYPWALQENRLIITDLPGIGVSGDSYARVTEKFVREEAQAIILVTNRSGIDSGSRELLARSGFLQRLIHSADCPEADPLMLIVVATKADEPAASELEHAEQNGDILCPITTLVRFRQELKEMLHLQLRNELNGIAENLSGIAKKTIDQVIDRVVKQAKFHAVSSTQYNRFLNPGHSGNLPVWVNNSEQTGIPELNLDISISVEDFQQRKLVILEATLRKFEEQLSFWTDALEQKYNIPFYDRKRLEEIKRTLRNDLAPLLKEVQARLGGFRGFLEETLPEAIETVLATAKGAAADDIRRYLGRLQEMHWTSLRAAVRKGGTHYGVNHVHLPRTFSDHLEGHIAPLWQAKVRQSLSNKLGELAEDLSTIVREMGAWAVRQEIHEGPILALACEMEGDISRLRSLVEDSNQELREAVQNRLYRAIRPPIERACLKFVEANLDRGTGTKYRILACFQGVLSEVMALACDEARRILTEALDPIRTTTRERLRPYADIQAAMERQLDRSWTPEKIAEVEKQQKEALEVVGGMRIRLGQGSQVVEGTQAIRA